MDDARLHAVKPVNAHRGLLRESEALLKREVEFRILEDVLQIVTRKELGNNGQIAASGAGTEEEQ